MLFGGSVLADDQIAAALWALWAIPFIPLTPLQTHDTISSNK
jgi:hypothetical protein